MDSGYLDLLQLQTVVKEGVESVLPDCLWLKAEVASLSARRGGHCYLDLSESVDGKMVAQMRAIIWSSVWRQIAPCFESVAGAPLQAGQQVLLYGYVQYSPLYGLSFIINDIDPSFTIGEAERKRAETLERLRREDLLEKQKQLSIRDLPYRLAVVSAETAAGYRDFMRHLHENEYGFRFSTTLFEAPMQGADCATGIASALERIQGGPQAFDAVLILRGGGGKLDLACFDEYDLCAAVARCKYPVLTAVGHDQDTHLCDMVAFDAVKTPTALADWFLEPYMDCDALLYSLEQRLKSARKTRCALMESRLDVLLSRIEAADPARLLEKGFVLVTDASGHPLRRAAGCSAGDNVMVVLRDGRLECSVKNVKI